VSLPLTAYLHDHLAGSNFAIELLERMRDQHAGQPIGQFAASELGLLLRDRDILLRILDRVGSEESVFKQAAAWVAEKASRFKLKNSGPEAFEIFESLELLAVGIHGRAALWRVLAVIALLDHRLQGEDYESLAEEARQQHDRVERRRLDIAPSALTSANTPAH